MWVATSLYTARRQQLPKLITANPTSSNSKERELTDSTGPQEETSMAVLVLRDLHLLPLGIDVLLVGHWRLVGQIETESGRTAMQKRAEASRGVVIVDTDGYRARFQFLLGRTFGELALLLLQFALSLRPQ